MKTQRLHEENLLVREWIIVLMQQRWWVVVAYLILCIIYFFPTFVTGAVPLPLLNAHAIGDPVWSGVASSNINAGTNTLLTDVSQFYFPLHFFSITHIPSGQFPLWNPYLFGGMPYFAANQGALLFPINLLCYGLGPLHYWTAAAILRMLIAGCGTYGLLRRLGAGRVGAFLSGGLYMFASFNIVFLFFAIHNVAVLLPVALWLTLVLIEAPRLQTAFGLAGVVAAQMLAGHPEMAVFSMLVQGCFAIVWLARRASWRRKSVLVMLAYALGIGLSAVQWLPTLALLPGSETVVSRKEELRSAAQTGFTPIGGPTQARWSNFQDWLLLITPELWGSPRGATWHYWQPDPEANYNELAVYVGIIALPLAGLGALSYRNQRATWFFGGLFLISMVLLYPLPGFHRLGYLPFIDFARGMRSGMTVALALVVLAGLGLDQLIQTRRWVLWVLAEALLGLVVLNALITYDLWGGTRVHWVFNHTPDLTLNDQTRQMIAAVYQWSNLRPLLPGIGGILALCLLGVILWKRVSVRYLQMLLTALALTELLSFEFGYNRFTLLQDVYPVTPAIATMQRDLALFRILPLDHAFDSNTAMTQGLQVVTGLDDMVPYDLYEFINRGHDILTHDGVRTKMLNPESRRIIDMMNVHYVVARNEVTASPSQAPLELLMTDRDLRVYRNPTALPRAYAATAVVQVAPGTGKDRVFAAQFDPWKAVVLEETPSILLNITPVSVTAVPVTAYTPNRVELAPDLATPAVVVLADSFDPDWQVTVDGQSAPMLRANGMFRGVAVPAGHHQVVFNYWPRMVLLGASISIVSLLTMVVLFGWVRWRQVQS